MAATTSTTGELETTSSPPIMSAGLEPTVRVAAWALFVNGLLWGWALFRWVTFATFDWSPFPFEEALATFPAIFPYVMFIGGLGVDLLLGLLLLRQTPFARAATFVRCGLMVLLVVFYWLSTNEFFGAIYMLGLTGFLVVLLSRQIPWAINYAAAFFLLVFFVAPNVIVFIISLSERGPNGTIIYPLATGQNIFQLFDDYGRFFSRISGQLLYLRILWRSFWIASVNTIVCLLFGYPFAYWIARRPRQWRGVLIFMVMIPFWTNFLVRTYAWMLLLRDSGLINNVWTGSIHNIATSLAESSSFFAWLASITADPLPLLFNNGSVLLGLFYGFFPFVVLPLYSNLEKLDWTLLEAAADLGANGFRSTTRVLLPLSLPGIVAAGIIVFVPSFGAYVTPDILGGGKVAMLGNLLQQQFLTTRDYPFGAAIGMLMMIVMLLAIMIYFRVGGREA